MDAYQITVDLVGNVAWPLAAAFAVWLFREQIRERLPHVRRIATPLGSAELDEAGVELAEDVEVAAKVLVGGGVQPAPGVSPTLNGDGGTQQPVESQPQPQAKSSSEVSDDDRRRALEQAITSAAQWGFKQAQIGPANRPPRVFISWKDDGTPGLGIERAEVVSSSLFADVTSQDYIRNLEAEVRRLRREHSKARAGLRWDDMTAIKMELDQALDRLRRVHPTSGLL